MDKTTAIQQIDATLKTKGFKYIGPGPSDYEGSIGVHGKNVQIKLLIPDVFFVKKVKALLVDRSQILIDTLAHVESDQGICYVSGAGLPLDIYQPGQAILRVIKEIERTLELSYKGRAELEIIEEYQNYWKANLDIRIFLSKNLEIGIHEAWSFFAYKGGKARFICLASERKLRGYEIMFPKKVQIWNQREKLGAANGIKVPKTFSELESWFSGQKFSADMNWEKAKKYLFPDKTLILTAPNAVVGIELELPNHLKAAVKDRRIREAKLPGLLKGKEDSIKINRYSGDWSSLEDVTARNNMNSHYLRNTSIALVGCGTIGSHLAKMLVQSGAGISEKITLFDKEVLSTGNIGRHLVGFDEVGEKKSLAVKKELERFHPYVRVSAIDDDALSNWDILKSHDIVIDATGEWNVQSVLNDNFLHNRGDKLKALLHSWIFMNGAAVQTFLNLGDDFACFRCLKPIFDGPWRYPAGDEKEELNLQPASCGDGAFIPFSVDVSTMAASLSNKVVLDWVNGNPGKRLRTVVTDIDRGRTQKPISPLPSKKCPACTKLR